MLLSCLRFDDETVSEKRNVEVVTSFHHQGAMTEALLSPRRALCRLQVTFVVKFVNLLRRIPIMVKLL